VIAAHSVSLADQDQRACFHITQAMRPVEVVASHAEVNELGQLGVRRPGELEKRFDLVPMPIAIVLGEESVGLDYFIVDEFFKPISTMSTTNRWGNPGMQSDPGRAAGPEPLAAMIRLFTRPGKFCANDSAILPPIE